MVELYRWDLWLYDFLTPKLFPVKMLQIFPWYFWGGWAWRKWCEWIFNLCPFPFQRVFFVCFWKSPLFLAEEERAVWASYATCHGCWGWGDPRRKWGPVFLVFLPPRPLSVIALFENSKQNPPNSWRFAYRRQGVPSKRRWSWRRRPQFLTRPNSHRRKDSLYYPSVGFLRRPEGNTYWSVRSRYSRGCTRVTEK